MPAAMLPSFALILGVRVAGFLREQPGRGQVAPVVNGGTVAWTVATPVLILVPITLILGVRVTSFLQEEPGHDQGDIGENGKTVTEVFGASYGSMGLSFCISSRAVRVASFLQE